MPYFDTHKYLMLRHIYEGISLMVNIALVLIINTVLILLNELY